MMGQSQPEWMKKLADWLSRQPRWVLAAGVLVLMAAGALVLGDFGSPAVQPIPGAADADPTQNSTFLAIGVFLRLILVVAAIYFFALLLKRWQSGNLKRADRRLALVESLHLTSRRSVHLVRAGDQVFLIGATDQTISLLGQIDGDEGNGSLSFEQQLAKVGQKQQETTGE
jgi:flagellar biosynthetic protein FliO